MQASSQLASGLSAIFQSWSLPQSDTTSTYFPFHQLPEEIFLEIFCHVEEPAAFASSCKFICHKGRDQHTVVRWLIRQYGKRRVLVGGFRNHPGLMRVEVVKALHTAGCHIPRFLVQELVQSAGRLRAELIVPAFPLLKSHHTTPGLLVYLMNEAYALYGEESAFTDSDIDWLKANYSKPEKTEALCKLFRTYGMIFTSEMISHPHVPRTLRLLGQIDMSIIKYLVHTDSIPVHECYILRAYLCAGDVQLARQFLKLGFPLNERDLDVGLRMCNDEVLDVLRENVPANRLDHAAHKLFTEQMAPAYEFSSNLADFLMRHFEIPESVVECSLLAPLDFQSGPEEVERAASRNFAPKAGIPILKPLTYPYHQKLAGYAWKWVLQYYGPNHRFTQYCFEDTIMVIGRSTLTRPTVYDFLAAGVEFRPRHVRCLANMAILSPSPYLVLAAHDLVRRLISQVMATHDPHVRGDWLDVFKLELERLQELVLEIEPLPMPDPEPTTENPSLPLMRQAQGVLPVWAPLHSRGRRGPDPAFPVAWFILEFENTIKELEERGIPVQTHLAASTTHQ
ncbi:hypothetical protein DFS34DRAFT_248270 [Phlyctochytrium arcticum]|nr:hypothetical protein DFS34DRAFT_248270 [Phlyctochytrium arcticum]